MKRIVILLILASVQLTTIAQPDYKPSDTLIISGKVKNVIRLSFADIQAMPDTLFAAGSNILAHDGKIKRTLPSLKGVLLKNILNKTTIDLSKRQALNSVYILCVANDGYKVLYSWNELFNNPTGNNTYIVTATDNNKESFADDKILLVTASDILSGKRFVKNLQEIIIGHIE